MMFISRYIVRRCMSKLLILIFSVVSLSGLYQVSFISASPAVEVEVTCPAVDANGGGSLYLTGTELSTNSNNNNLERICHGIITDPPEKAIVWNAYNVADEPTTCMNDDASRSTYDWHETISVSGMVTLTCHFKD